MTTMVIRNEDDAYEWFQAYLEGRAEPPEIDFERWPRLSIRLQGPQFQNSLTPSVMRGFIELQTALNRSYTLAAYGHTNTHSLSKEERDHLELRVEVDEGSSILTIDIQQFLETVAARVVAGMDPITLGVTLLGFGALYASNVAYKSYLNNKLELRKIDASTEQEQAHLETITIMSQQETERAKLFAEVVKRVPALQESLGQAEHAKESLFKGAARAVSTEIDGLELESADVQELTKNTRREPREVRLDGNYRILRNDTQDPNAFRVKLKNVDTGAELDARVQDESTTDRTKNALREAEWSRSVIYLRVNATSLDGEMKRAVVIGTGDGVDAV